MIVCGEKHDGVTPCAEPKGKCPMVSLVKDPDAPYGRKADGTPKAKPGRPSSGATGTASSSRAKKSKASTEYAPAIEGLFQLIAFPVAFAYPADAAAITHYAPGIAKELDALAQVRPEVAAALDRVLSVGPYGAVIAATLPLVIQLLVNHGVIPIGAVSSFGVVPKETILRGLGVPVEEKTEESEREAA